jgi:hypothetical protein
MVSLSDALKTYEKPAEVESLTLDGKRGPALTGLTPKFAALKSLSAIGCNIVTLDDFPSLPQLRKVSFTCGKYGLECSGMV